MTLLRTCQAPGCSASLEGRDERTKTCSSACRLRLHRAKRRPHPYRNTPQYTQMRKEWAEYPGRHWLPSDDGKVDRDELDGEDIDYDHGSYAGSWDRYLRQTHQQYATGY